MQLQWRCLPSHVNRSCRGSVAVETSSRAENHAGIGLPTISTPCGFGRRCLPARSDQPKYHQTDCARPPRTRSSLYRSQLGIYRRRHHSSSCGPMEHILCGSARITGPKATRPYRSWHVFPAKICLVCVSGRRPRSISATSLCRPRGWLTRIVFVPTEYKRFRRSGKEFPQVRYPWEQTHHFGQVPDSWQPGSWSTLSTGSPGYLRPVDGGQRS